MRRLAPVLAALLFAGTAGALETVLTRESVLYSVQHGSDGGRLEISRRASDVAETLVVPTTEDAAVESDTQLVFDQQSGTLYVAWRRAGEDDRILLASYGADGTWSEPLVVASGPAKHAGLNLELTRLDATTFVHAAWWYLDCDAPAPQYALVAFEEGAHVSTDIEDLIMLANVASLSGVELDDTSNAEHPPLSMAKADDGVDVVFGEHGATSLTRVRVSPKLQSEARMWTPVGKNGGHLPSAKFMSASTDPVRSFISKGRVVLYTPDAQFRFVVFENGRWSPTRMIQLDESISPDTLTYELRKTIDEQSGAEDDIVTH